MKIIKYIIAVCLIALGVSSCLEYGLDELPAYDLNEIEKISFETRTWDTADWDSTQFVLVVEKVNIRSMEYDSLEYTYHVSVSKRTDVLDSVVCYMDISEGAKIAPVGNTPKLGTVGDYTQEGLQYEVTAANGNKQIYNLEVTGL